jgi:hypothetical protein
MALSFEHDLAFEGAAEIAVDRCLENLADMVAQRIADIEALAAY